jgi:small-conductance mechanosensitive channel
MKTKPALISLLISAALIASCKPAPDKPATQATEPTTAQQLNKVETATKDAAKEMQEYAYAQKAEFVTSMQAKLVDLNRSIDELSAKIESSSDRVKTEAKPKLAALREQSAGLTKQVDAMQSATEKTWDSAKAEAQKGYTALKEGFAQARQWISDKIEP